MSVAVTGSISASGTISRYQWLTLLSGFLGWAFDTMDLSLFTIILVPSVSELTGSRDPAVITQIGAWILAAKLVCWGLGGIIFGVVADRFGRARTMIVTILIYSVFTGLSGLARNWQELAVLQALSGFGIGGEWSAGAALIAETWPKKYRPRAMQLMQMAFAVGFFLAALDNLILGPISWRWVLAVGAFPAVISLAIRYYVPEPERWRAVRSQDNGRPGGLRSSAWTTFITIFHPPFLRKTIIGVLVSSAMMVGCWGGLALLPNWIAQLVRSSGGTNGVQTASYAFMLMMVGGAAGYISLIWLAEWLGRRGSYFLFCAGSLLVSLCIFLMVKDIVTLLWWMPVYGYFAIGGFGTFALYLPELFPTRVRATGQGFCWNFARIITAVGPLAAGTLIAASGSLPGAAAACTSAYVIGLVAIWFGPETRGLSLQD